MTKLLYFQLLLMFLFKNCCGANNHIGDERHLEAGSSKDTKHVFRCDYQYRKELDVFIKYHEIPAVWSDARLRCHLEGAKLASPVNIKMAALMSSVMDLKCAPCKVHTGIHALFSRGDYISLEGFPLNLIPHVWEAKEPNNLFNRDNVLTYNTNGKFADENENERYPYICYKKREYTGVGVCGTTDNEYKFESRTGSCYKFHDTPRNWSRAMMTCMAEGGYLTIINDEIEALVLAELFENLTETNFTRGKILIGFQDWGEHRDWLTIKDQTLIQAGYSKFMRGIPDFKKNQFCGAVYKNGYLGNEDCESPHNFICEKHPMSLVNCGLELVI